MCNQAGQRVKFKHKKSCHFNLSSKSDTEYFVWLAILTGLYSMIQNRVAGLVSHVDTRKYILLSRPTVA